MIRRRRLLSARHAGPGYLAALACLAGLACMTPACMTPAWADSVALRDSVPHITATGQASAEVVPDRADIRLGVSNERPGAEAATAATAEQAATVVEAIKAQGIAAADVKTNFSLAAQYDSATDPKTHITRRILRGYAASARITVRVRDVAKAGGLSRSLIDKGANSFQGIDYFYAGEKALRRQLDGEAAKDAEAAARVYTDALGLRLGRVLQVGGDAPVLPPPMFAAGAPSPEGAGSVAIPTEPGTQTFTRNATVTFEIEGAAR